MAIILPHEIQTTVEGSAGCIYIFQEHKGHSKFVRLTVHQFQEIWNYEKHLIDEAREEKDPK